MDDPKTIGMMVLYRISELYESGKYVKMVSYLPYMSITGTFTQALKRAIRNELYPVFYITWNDEKMVVSGNSIEKVEEFDMSYAFLKGRDQL